MTTYPFVSYRLGWDDTGVKLALVVERIGVLGSHFVCGAVRFDVGLSIRVNG